MRTPVELRARPAEHLPSELIDCDDFKSINDRLGHAAGDATLAHVARSLTSALRPGDILGRVGGDEFLVFVPDARLPEGMLVAEKLRLAVASAVEPVGVKEGRMTISCAVASVSGATVSIEEVLSACHPPLKESKATGKNKVSVSALHEEGPNFELEVPSALKRLHPLAQPIVAVEDEQIATA